jgi:hypothetical protein
MKNSNLDSVQLKLKYSVMSSLQPNWVLDEGAIESLN